MRNIKILLILILLSNPIIHAQNKIMPKENCGNIKTKQKMTKVESKQLNVLGKPLSLASIDPVTGFYRNGYCQTDANDKGLHVVAAIVTNEFLQYSKLNGNDLITPYPENNFPGLKAGDIWCLCVLRWKEAFDAGAAPPVLLEATNIKALQYVTLEQLKSIKTK
jgi:uncharacterized protein